MFGEDYSIRVCSRVLALAVLIEAIATRAVVDPRLVQGLNVIAGELRELGVRVGTIEVIENDCRQKGR